MKVERRAIAVAMLLTGGFCGWSQSAPSPGAGGTEPVPPARAVFGPGLNSPAPGLAINQGAAVSMTISISGQVVASGGGPPVSPALVEARCEGAQGGSTYSDKKGKFVVGIGQKSEYAEAAIDGDSALHCVIEASLAGYHSARVQVWSARDRPLLTLRSLGATQGTLISYTDLDVPKRAREARAVGMAALQKHDWTAAQTEFEKAVKLYPQYAAAWHDLGAALTAEGQLRDARAAWDKSIALDSRFLPPYERLAELDAAGSNWRAMAAITDRAVAMDPVDAPVLYLYHAIAYFNLGRMDIAEQSSRRAIALDGHRQLPRAQYILGRALAHRNDYPGALEHMRRYLEMLPSAPDAAVVRAQIEDAQKHAGS